MSRFVAKRLAWQDEQGALLVLTAIFVPAIVMLGALTFGVTALWTAHDDVQRSADLGAVVGAADTPTAVVTPSAATMPIPITGMSVIHNKADELDPGDWKARACLVAYQELGEKLDEGAPERSYVTRGFAGDGEGPNCVHSWMYESPTLAVVGACAADLIDITGCGSKLRTELSRTIPAVDSTDPVVADVMAAAQTLHDEFTNSTDLLMTAVAAQQLPNACTAGVDIPLSGFVCTERASDRLNALLGTISNTLAIAPSGTPQLGVNLDGLLPAVMTPRVEITMEKAPVKPPFYPFTFSIGSTAVARRTIKSALVLPSGAIPYPELTTDLDAHFGQSGASLALAATAGVGGYAIDPNIIGRTADRRVDKTLDLFDKIDERIGEDILGATTTTVCTTAPSKYCPQIDTVAGARAIRGQFVQDLHDATRPPPKGAEPSLQDWLDDAADSGDPQLLVQTLRPTNLKQVFGASAWSVLTDPSINPALAPLLSDLMYIPALDVVPVTVGRVKIGPQSYFVLKSIAMDTLATKGLYQARLVK